MIKGPAGSGKTTLALELLRLFATGGNGIYLSTRVNPMRMFIQFPWLKRIIESKHVLDTTQTYERREHALEAFRIYDFRLREAPSFLETIYALACEISNRTTEEKHVRPFIVADSWDGTAKELEEKRDRLKIEKAFVALVDKANATIIFVSEEPEQTTLDYLVDGVVELCDDRVEDRRIREIYLRKLRGIKISQPIYLFTLQDGRFKCFGPHEVQTPTNSVKLEPIPDPDKDHISSGVRDFDEILGGGFLRGSVNILEFKQGGEIANRSLIFPLIVNHLNLGRPVVSVPFEGATAREYEVSMKQFLRDPASWGRQVVSFERGGGTEPYIKELGSTMEEQFERYLEAAETKTQECGSPLLDLVGLDTMEHTYGASRVIELLSQATLFYKTTGNVGLTVGIEGQEILEEVKHMAATYWRIESRNRATVIYGVIPQTGLYALEYTRENPINIRLTPVV